MHFLMHTLLLHLHAPSHYSLSLFQSSFIFFFFFLDSFTFSIINRDTQTEKMLGGRVHLSVRTIPSFLLGALNDQSNVGLGCFRFPLFNSSTCCCSSSSLLGFRTRKSSYKGGINSSILISCKASQRDFHGGRSGGGHGDEHDDNNNNNDEYLEAFVLISETIRHYQLLKQGFVEETKLPPFSVQAKELRTGINSIGHGFLRRFKSPTIFLKVTCDGELLLPIFVGEPAIEKLIDSSREDETRDCPSQFQFMKNLVDKLGYEVAMVRITERVVNTYYSRIYFNKPGQRAFFSVDARPSDAINVARRCKVPVYVNRQIVLTDAIRIGYGARRGSDSKSTYDVTLDSAAEGPDLVSEELDMIRNLNIAVKEERYKDAAMWRDKLTQLRTPRLQL